MIIVYMLCPICYFVRFAINSKSDVRFAIQPREWKNLENGSKTVENAFENDLKLSRMHLITSRIELKTSRIDSNLENELIF